MSSRYRHSRPGAGFPPMTAPGSNPLPARSDGLDNVDGGPDAAFYIQIGVIEQVSIRCRFLRRCGPVLVAFVALEDICQHRGLVGILAARPRLRGSAAGADFWVGNDENRPCGIWAGQGA